MSEPQPLLLNAVLAGSFRPNAHGQWLLTEMLPPELPLDLSDAKVDDVWAQLVRAQQRYVKLGAPFPDEFRMLVRQFVAAMQQAGGMTPAQRAIILDALSLGPGIRRCAHGGYHWLDDEGREVGGCGHQCGGEVLHDKALRRHWDEWAKDARRWGKTDWAYWRFVRRFSLGRALDRAYDEFDAEQQTWLAELAEREARDSAEYHASLPAN